MRHTNLVDRYSSNAQANEKLCREKCPVRVDADSLQRITTKELRGAVNVADAQSEPDTIRNTVERGIDKAQWRIGALQSIPDHYG